MTKKRVEKKKNKSLNEFGNRHSDGVDNGGKNNNNRRRNVFETQ